MKKLAILKCGVFQGSDKVGFLYNEELKDWWQYTEEAVQQEEGASPDDKSYGISYFTGIL